jgi:hypothetical protein
MTVEMVLRIAYFVLKKSSAIGNTQYARMYRFVGLFFASILLFVACQAGGNTLKPIRPEATPVGPFDSRPIPVSFSDLNDNPGAYQNKLIRVSGTYTRLPLPTCGHTSGPRLEWALVSGNLRLDARGFEPVLRLLPGGIILTVDGFWRQYQGPLGCGKEADDGTAWYLETLQIVQPNPLPGVFEVGVSPGVDQPPDPLAPTPDGTGTAEPELQITLIAGTPTGTIGLTPSPTTSGGIPTSTPTRTPTLSAPVTGTATPSRTPTVPITGTPPTPTPTPTPSQTPPPGATQPGPATPTSIVPSTPPGYPGPGDDPPPTSYP